MNLLPVPALDGGRLVFIILEMLRGKRLIRKKAWSIWQAAFDDADVICIV